MQQVFINDSQVAENELGFNHGLNFGRFFKDTIVVRYAIHISKIDFIQILETPYTNARNEIKADDEKYKDTSDFTEVNYCSFTELLEHPRVLTDIFDTYLRHDFFKDFTSPSVNYMINSIDQIKVSENITILGRAYRIKK